MKSKVILYFILVSILSYSQTITKKGGICFRIDDNHSIDEYNEYARRFDKYNKKFCFALNLGRKEFESNDYVNGVRQLQANGHELMDHTPEHRTSFFLTEFEPSSYSSLPGVDHIVEHKICLKYTDVDTNKARKSGFVDIDSNNVISSSNKFDSFSPSERYLYFPDLPTPKLVIWKEIINTGLLKVMDFWQESIDLGKHNHIRYYSFTQYDIHMTIAALNLLANETRKLADSFNIERPVSWIQPGVSTNYFFPYVYMEEIKQSLGKNYNYVAAAVYPYTSEKTYKVFNEYDPNEDKNYGMQWGDFNVDAEPLHETKMIIADGIAKHHVLIGSSHFNNLLGGWDAYLERVDSILSWCTKNNIPVRTYKEWSDILYKQTADPFENIFPALYKDLDNNGIPDGYETIDGVWNSDDGVDSSNNSCYSINSEGTFFKIKDLGGVEKGENSFEIWTKGEKGDSIEVIFKVRKQEHRYKFPAENDAWTLYTLNQSTNGNHSLNIPEQASMIDVSIRCSNYLSGVVKVSGMKLSKKKNTNTLIVAPPNISVSSDSGSTTFSIISNVNWNISVDADWVVVSPLNGNNNGTITVSYEANIDSLSRTATITVSGGGISKNITVIQEGLSVYKITSETNPKGTADILGDGNYLAGVQTNITCVPYTGWKFNKWTEDGDVVSTDSSFSFIVDRSHHFVANLSMITSVNDFKTSIPTEYKLFQNYPNPFNPITTIKFGLPVASFVTLEVYNSLGKKIKTLVDKNLTAGYYSIIFEADKCPSGIYMYRIRAGKFKQTNKLIILK